MKTAIVILMAIEDRLIEDQDFYVRVQKLKLLLCVVAIAFLLSACATHTDYPCTVAQPGHLARNAAGQVVIVTRAPQLVCKPREFEKAGATQAGYDFLLPQAVEKGDE